MFLSVHDVWSKKRHGDIGLRLICVDLALFPSLINNCMHEESDSSEGIEGLARLAPEDKLPKV